MTRYFMTVEESVRLVIQAGAIGSGGEVLVLDMGEPVRICDVARQLIEQAGSGIGIEYTGLRQGEKLHECLIGAGETDLRPFHPQISHVKAPPLSMNSFALLEELYEPEAVADALRGVAYAAPCSGAGCRSGLVRSGRDVDVEVALRAMERPAPCHSLVPDDICTVQVPQ